MSHAGEREDNRESPPAHDERGDQCRRCGQDQGAARHSSEKIGFHAPGLTGVFGSAVVTGLLMKVDVERMTHALAHRGPDDWGVHVEGGVGLGHRRLSIIDVEGGQQPLGNEDGSVWVAYNGEIYNHLDLRQELLARGHQFRTRCDTEVLVHAYEEFGSECVDHLNGMFAFAIWDSPRQRLFLARDRLGIKPLYYALTEDELLFASEIKAILAAGLVRPAFNQAILPEFLATGFVSGEETFFRGVRKLQPGRTLTWSPGARLTERRYWHLPARLDDGPETLEDRRPAEVRRLTLDVWTRTVGEVRTLGDGPILLVLKFYTITSNPDPSTDLYSTSSRSLSDERKWRAKFAVQLHSILHTNLFTKVGGG